MTEYLLKLLNVHVDSAARVTGMELSLKGGNIGMIIFLMIVLVVGAFVLYHWAGDHIPFWRRILMATFRAALFVLILGLFLRPVLTFTVQGSFRRTLVLLFDGTGSMAIQDPRSDADETSRAAIDKNVIDPTKGLKQSVSANDSAGLTKISRIDLVKAAFRNPRLDLLHRLSKGLDLRPYTFGDTLTDLSPPPAPTTNESDKPDPSKPPVNPDQGNWLDKLPADAPDTPLGDRIRQVISETRGQPLAGIVVVTDGQSNAGSPPQNAAAIAGQEGVPLFLWGVGTTPKDIIVANLFSPEVAFIKDEVPVTVRVRSQNLDGQKAVLKLSLGKENDTDHSVDYTEVDSQDVNFGPDGEQAIQMKFTPDKAGNFKLKASIEPRDDEVVKTNNEQVQDIRIVDGKIKVLLVEQSPRWEFKYLQALLARDRRVDMKCVLFDGDPGLTKGDKTPYLPGLPEVKEDLYKYDMIILGDVDPEKFTPAQLDMFEEFVTKFGGGFLVIAGKMHMPEGYRGTKLEKMLPVELDEVPEDDQALANHPVHLEMTPAGDRSPMLRLSDNALESKERWAKLPPIYWEKHVGRAKPAAEVLLVDADSARGASTTKMPVVALQQYGLGQVMYVGTDNTWRWRKNRGDQYYITLWEQMVQRIALPHLLGAAKRTQLTSEKTRYVTGERVSVFARLYGTNYEPIKDPTVKGYFAVKGDTSLRSVKGTFQLQRLPDQPGMYRGEFVAPDPSSYQFYVESDPDTRLDFTVTAPHLETDETAMNQSALSEMARLSGGLFLREEDLYKLPDEISAKAEKVESTVEVDLAFTWIYLLMILGVASSEWILRKVFQLK